MKEIYWLTRIGEIHTIFDIMWIAPLVLAGIALLTSPMWDEIFEEEHTPYIKKTIKWSFISLCIGLIGSTFVPSKRDIYFIYGVGSTLEYIKGSEKARELPDKAVEALTKYLESFADDDKKK